MARARRRSRKKASGSGVGWLVVGLAIGLSVAAWVRWSGPATEEAATKPPVPAAADMPSASSAPPVVDAPPTPADERFDFYDVLPSFEVVVPEASSRGTGDVRPPPVEAPGTYVLQAGSFPGFADADAVKARLALLGVSSHIQKVSIDDRAFHRVRIGPIESLGELNRLREQLRENRIEFLVIQVRE